MNTTKRSGIGRAVLLLLGIALFLAAAVMRMHYSDEVFSAELKLSGMKEPAYAVPVKLIAYSEKKSDFRLQYSGNLRAQPTEMSWDDAVKLRAEILAQAQVSPALLTELMSVSNAMGYAEQYSHATTMVRLAYVCLAASIACILCSAVLTIRSRKTRKATLGEHSGG